MEYRYYMKENVDFHSNERNNMYTAILNSMTQLVRNRLIVYTWDWRRSRTRIMDPHHLLNARNRLNETAHDTKDGVLGWVLVLVIWLINNCVLLKLFSKNYSYTNKIAHKSYSFHVAHIQNKYKYDKDILYLLAVFQTSTSHWPDVHGSQTLVDLLQKEQSKHSQDASLHYLVRHQSFYLLYIFITISSVIADDIIIDLITILDNSWI